MDPIRLPRDGYVTFTVGIENTGSNAVYIPKSRCSDTWQFNIVDGNGRQIPFRLDGESPDREPSREDLEKLEPGLMAAVHNGGAHPLGRYLATPGRYVMRLSCKSPLQWNEMDKLRVWNREDPTLTTSLEFEVVE